MVKSTGCKHFTKKDKIMILKKSEEVKHKIQTEYNTTTAVHQSERHGGLWWITADVPLNECLHVHKTALSLLGFNVWIKRKTEFKFMCKCDIRGPSVDRWPVLFRVGQYNSEILCSQQGKKKLSKNLYFYSSTSGIVQWCCPGPGVDVIELNIY